MSGAGSLLALVDSGECPKLQYDMTSALLAARVAGNELHDLLLAIVEHVCGDRTEMPLRDPTRTYIDMLVEYGASTDWKHAAALVTSCRGSCPEVVDVLLKRPPQRNMEADSEAIVDKLRN